MEEEGMLEIVDIRDATEEEISKIEQSIFKAGAISRMLDEKLSLIDIAKKVTGDENVEVIEAGLLRGSSRGL